MWIRYQGKFEKAFCWFGLTENIEDLVFLLLLSKNFMKLYLFLTSSGMGSTRDHIFHNTRHVSFSLSGSQRQPFDNSIWRMKFIWSQSDTVISTGHLGHLVVNEIVNEWIDFFGPEWMDSTSRWICECCDVSGWMNGWFTRGSKISLYLYLNPCLYLYLYLYLNCICFCICICICDRTYEWMDGYRKLNACSLLPCFVSS